MKLSTIATWVLASALGAQADWAPFDVNESECQTCMPGMGQGILLYGEEDVTAFCRKIMDACADGQVDKVTHNAGDGGNAVFLWEPSATDGNNACPSTEELCFNNVNSVRAGQCPANAVTASGIMQLSSGGDAGLVLIAGGCFCASPSTC